MESCKVVILCGGLGTRLREQTEFMPKPLVAVGGRPILWHIMKIYAHFNYNSFICCLGYKGEMIRQYFLNYAYMNQDFTITLGKQNKKVVFDGEVEDWSVTLCDTGVDTMTGGRIKRIEKFVDTENFLVTYGDGVADVNLEDLVRFHIQKGKIATLCGIHPVSRFGIIERNPEGIVERFREKPNLDGIINGGFFVFNRKIFDYLDEYCILEKEPMEQLARDKELSVYEHNGFWFCMDTYRDFLELNAMWNDNKAPWKIWNE